MSKAEKAKFEAAIAPLLALFDEVFDPFAPLGIALRESHNLKLRRVKFARFMRRKLGKDWEDCLSQGPYGKIPGGDALLLERLDRAGRLKDGLTVQEVQKGAEHILRVMANGEQAGRALGLDEHQLPPNVQELKGAPLGLELAEAVGASAEFRQRGPDGPAWLHGYITGFVSGDTDRATAYGPLQNGLRPPKRGNPRDEDHSNNIE